MLTGCLDVNGPSELIRLLESSQRMEIPKYAPTFIGDLMLQCWKHNQDERITFEQAERFLGELVDDSTRQRFASSESLGYISNTDIPITADLRMTSVDLITRSDCQNVDETLSSNPKLYPQLSTCSYIDVIAEPKSQQTESDSQR